MKFFYLFHKVRCMGGDTFLLQLFFCEEDPWVSRGENSFAYLLNSHHVEDIWGPSPDLSTSGPPPVHISPIIMLAATNSFFIPRLHVLRGLPRLVLPAGFQ